MSAGLCDSTVDSARAVLALDAHGRPRCPDNEAVFAAIAVLRRDAPPDVVADVVDHGFLGGAAERYAEHGAPLMRAIPAVRFVMGSDEAAQRHFCGEAPRHQVALSAFAIGAVPVTNALYGMFDPRRLDAPAAHPVTDVTWYDAAVFALWVGCRLPTEAEWEYACGAGAGTEWCCASEDDLPRYAWYSENADDRPHPVGTREPNALGLHDLHGNVWEWCADAYAPDFYARSPVDDPRNDVGDHRTARGGGFYALAEMCRTRFRLHDPADYWACDLGFRLARSSRC
jgi:formylglycine-generating enzyme required for sulfatase activity